MIKQDPTLSVDDGRSDNNRFDNNGVDNNSFDNSFDNFLSAQLKQAQPYLDDNAFTAQVMARLPAAKKLSVWQERLIILVPLVIISLLVISQFSVLAVAVKLWTLLFSVDVASLLNVGLVISAAALCGASYWFARQLKFV